jgi:hypothetical protein
MAIRHTLSFPHLERRRSMAAVSGPRRRQTDGVALRFDEAIRLATHEQWAPAFDALAGLANAGHPASARMALMLARRGAALFGGRFAATAQEMQHWQLIGG